MNKYERISHFRIADFHATSGIPFPYWPNCSNELPFAFDPIRFAGPKSEFNVY